MRGSPLIIPLGQAKIVGIRQRGIERARQAWQGRSQPAQQNRISKQEYAEGHDAPPQP